MEGSEPEGLREQSAHRGWVRYDVTELVRAYLDGAIDLREVPSDIMVLQLRPESFVSYRRGTNRFASIDGPRRTAPRMEWTQAYRGDCPPPGQ